MSHGIHRLTSSDHLSVLQLGNIRSHGEVVIYLARVGDLHRTRITFLFKKSKSSLVVYVPVELLLFCEFLDEYCRLFILRSNVGIFCSPSEYVSHCEGSSRHGELVDNDSTESYGPSHDPLALEVCDTRKVRRSCLSSLGEFEAIIIPAIFDQDHVGPLVIIPSARHSSDFLRSDFCEFSIRYFYPGAQVSKSRNIHVGPWSVSVYHHACRCRSSRESGVFPHLVGRGCTHSSCFGIVRPACRGFCIRNLQECIGCAEFMDYSSDDFSWIFVLESIDDVFLIKEFCEVCRRYFMIKDRGFPDLLVRVLHGDTCKNKTPDLCSLYVCSSECRRECNRFI